MKYVGKVDQKKDLSTKEYADIKTNTTLFEDIVINNTTIYADAVRPLQDPAARDGWYFKNDWTKGTNHLTLANFPQYETQENIDALCKTKINWYFFDGTSNTTTWADFKYAYAVVTIDGTNNPFFYIYNQALARFVFSVKSADFTTGKTYLMWFGNEEPPTDLYPALPRVRMTKANPQPANSDFVTTVAYTTNSGDAQNTCILQTYSLGYATKTSVENFDLKISSSVSNIPSGGGGGAVSSVNGQTGDVTISATSLNVYTKTETDTLLGGKSNTGHDHNIADVTGLQTALDGKADDATTLSGYGITDAYTKTEADTLLAGKSILGHTHTSTEVSFTPNEGFPNVPAVTSVDGALKNLKDYSDSLVQGITSKKEVKATTTGQITLSGEQTLDGISCLEGDRVLVKDQTNAAENGIYVVKKGVWDRATDFDAPSEASGAYVFVQQGTTWADTGWVVTSDSIATIGTSPINWSQFSRAGVVQAGTGITKTGNAIVSLANAYATTAGSLAAYTLTVADYPSSLASLEGYSIKFKANRTATGTITLNVNGSSAKSILTSDGLNVGTLTQNSVYTVVYNGSAFILQGEGGEIRSTSKLTTKTIKVDEAVVRGDVLESYYQDFSVNNALLSTNYGIPILGSVECSAWSPNGTFLAIGVNAAPYLLLYKRNGNTLTQMAAQTSSSGVVSYISWSPDSVSFVVWTKSTSTNLYYYRRHVGDTFERFSLGTASLTNTFCQWSANNEYIAVSISASPWLRFYKRGATGFTAVSPVSGLTEAPVAFDWSPDSTYFAASFGTSGNFTLRIYKRSTGDSFTELTSTRVTITNTANINTISWNSNNVIAISGNATGGSYTQNLFIYNFIGETLSSVSLSSVTLPSGNITCAKWHPSNAYLFLGVYYSLRILKCTENSFSILPDNIVWQSGFYNYYSIDFTPDGKYIVTTGYGFDNGSFILWEIASPTVAFPLFRKISSHTNEIGSLDKVIAVARQNGSAGSSIAASIIVGSNNV